MTYTAVFDESGKWRDCKRVVFAGLVGDQARLNGEFSIGWNRALHKARLPGTRTKEGWPYFHAKELARRYKRSSNATEREQLTNLFTEAAQLIADSFIEGSINTIVTEDFERLSHELRSKHRDPYYFAFESGIGQLTTSPLFRPADTIQLICDDSEEYSCQTLRCYRRLKRLKPSIAKRIPAICFVDDRSYAPLQAADLFAYCCRAKHSGEAEGIWAKPLDLLLSRFSESSRADILIS